MLRYAIRLDNFVRHYGSCIILVPRPFLYIIATTFLESLSSFIDTDKCSFVYSKYIINRFLIFFLSLKV